MIAYSVPSNWIYGVIIHGEQPTISDKYRIGCFCFTDQVIPLIDEFNGYMVLREEELPWPSDYIEGPAYTQMVKMPYVAFDNDEDAALFKLTYL